MGIEKGGLGILAASALSILASDESGIAARLKESIDAGKFGTRSAVTAVYDEGADDPDNQTDDLGNLLDVADPQAFMAMIKKDHPDVLARANAEYPEIMQAGLGDTLLGVLVVLLLLFGPKWVFSKAFGLGAGGVKLLRGRAGAAQEDGEVIARNQLPSLKDIIGEIVQNTDVAWNALTPVSRTILTEFYDFLVQRFEQMRFLDVNEARSLFKLGIKYKYIDVRIEELNTALEAIEAGTPAAIEGNRQQLEAELTALRAVEATILQAGAANNLEVAAIRRSATKRLPVAVNAEIDRVMPAKGATAGEIKELKRAFSELFQVPALHGAEGLLRGIKILRFKIEFWKNRYNRALLVAGPEVEAPLADAPVRVHQQYEAACAFIDLYEALRRRLDQRIEDFGPMQRAMVAIDSRLPSNPGRRSFVKWALALGAGGGLTWWLWDSDSDGGNAPATPSVGERVRAKDREELRQRWLDESLDAARNSGNPWGSLPQMPQNLKDKGFYYDNKGTLRRKDYDGKYFLQPDNSIIYLYPDGKTMRRLPPGADPDVIWSPYTGPIPDSSAPSEQKAP